MVTKYGMSENLGPINFGTGETEVFLGKDYNTVRNYSEEIAKDIDEEIRRIVTTGYDRCEAILNEHIDKLHELADYLIKNEKIDGEQFIKLMNGELEIIEDTVNENAASENESAEEE